MERISLHQFETLGAAVLMGTTFLPIASAVCGIAGRDGWLIVLPAFALGIPYGLMVLALMSRYPGKNLLEATEILFGKWIGKGIGVFYILISGYFGSLLLAQAGDIYQRSIMPQAPIVVLCLGTLLLVLYLVTAGIEVFARFSEVVFPLIVVGMILNMGLIIPRIEQGELLPILGDGLMPVLTSGLQVAPFPMEYILFLVGLLKFLPTEGYELKRLKDGVWRAVFTVGILNMLLVFMEILVFGPVETTRIVYGLLVLGKMVELSRTVAGVESLFMGIWLGALVIKASAFFFMVIWGLETVFKLKGKIWYLAVGIVFMAIALAFVEGVSMIQEVTMMDNYIILPFTAVWILVLWGVARWKG